MDYAMNRPWWPMMMDAEGRPGRRHGGKGRGRRGPGDDRGSDAGAAGQRPERGPGRHGVPFAGGPFAGGPGGPFPGGPGFAGGPFGPGAGGPFGHGPGGRHRRGSRARRGDVRAAILALLHEGPLNGYGIISTLDERTNGAWKPSPGAVYPALSQLEDEQLIEAFDSDGRKAFRLTESGVEAAAAVDPKPWDVVNDEAGVNTEGSADLWHEFGSLTMAARAVGASGSPAQLREAATVLAETRKRLFGILAADGEPQQQ